MIISYACNKRDESIAVQTLEWARQLDGKLDYDCVLSLGDGINGDPIIGAARQLFREVTVLEPQAPDSWPFGKNFAFQNLVRYLDDKKNRDCFAWIEPDSVPLKKGWLKTIEEAHISGGKPFSGYVHEKLQQMECVGVYPHNFMQYSPRNGMLCRAAPWDQCTRHEITPHVNRLNHLMQFVHSIDGFPPTFPKDSGLLRNDAVLFHSSKDGALVNQLSKGKIHRLLQLFKGDNPVVKKEKPVIVFMTWSSPVKNHNGHKVVLAYDSAYPPELLRDRLKEFGNVNVIRFCYPPSTDVNHQFAMKWGQDKVREYMSQQTAPWVFA